MRNVYLDCEFVREDLTATGLISVGLTSNGHSYYAVNSAMAIEPIRTSEWMTKHVWPHIPALSRFVLNRSHPDVRDYGVIRRQVSDFFEAVSETGDANEDVRLVAWCGAQDIVRLHGMWNHDWSFMPPWIPRYLHDLQEDIVDLGIREEDLPEQDPATLHHALHDAEHDGVLHDFITSKR